MPERMVYITNPDGRSYAVTPKDFAKGVDGDYHGFSILRWESGDEYEGPKTAAALTRASNKADRADADTTAKE